MLFRSSYLAAIKSCPRKAYYQYVLGLSTGQKDINLIFGSMMHDAIDIFHKTGCLEDGLTFINTHPELPQHPEKTKPTARILLAAYAVKSKMLEIDASEKEVTVNIGDHQAKLRFDAIAKWHGVKTILEHKTTVPSYLKTKPNDQFILYDLASEFSGEDTSGMLLNSMDCFKKEVTFIPISFSENEKILWMTETAVVLDNFERMIATHIFPQDPGSCVMYKKECAYMPLCHAKPSQHDLLIEKLFVINDEAKNLAW